jgi:hypothetical protein
MPPAEDRGKESGKGRRVREGVVMEGGKRRCGKEEKEELRKRMRWERERGEESGEVREMSLSSRRQDDT